MLMARKDKKCVGADLKKKMMEMQTRNKNDGKKTGKKSISPRRRKSDSERSTSPAGRKKTTKPAKKSTKATKSKNVSKRSNAAKQNPESFSSDSSGDEENALATMCQRVADMQRKKSASKSDDDLNDFIKDDTGYFNNNDLSDSELDYKIQEERGNSIQNNDQVKNQWVIQLICKTDHKEECLVQFVGIEATKHE